MSAVLDFSPARQARLEAMKRHPSNWKKDTMNNIRFETHEDGTPEWYDDNRQLLVQIDGDGKVRAFRKSSNWYDEDDVDAIRGLAKLISEADAYAKSFGK